MQNQTPKLRRLLKKTSEKVKGLINTEKNVIMFFDEGRFGLQPILGRCWALKGVRKKSKIKPGYKFCYMYSGVSPLTGESFSLLLPWVNTDVMNVYLNELSKEYSDKKVLIFMDQAGWHKSKGLKVPKNIQIDFLPPYSPELNPVEKLWQWVRRKACRNRLFDSLEDMTETISNVIKSMSNEHLRKLCNCDYMLHYK